MNPPRPSRESGLPLLAPRDLDAPLAWRHGVAVSGHAFLADVLRQQAALPPRGTAINLCSDRYAFAVGLAAALLRGQPSLLPPDARAETLARLQAAGADSPLYVLGDGPGAVCAAGAGAGLPCLRVAPAERTPAPPHPPVPRIDGDLHAVSLLTSGSTGAPQPHEKRWRTLVANVGAAAPRLAALLGRPSLAGLTLVTTVPVQHSYGIESSALLALLGGAAFDSGRPFYPVDIVDALASVPAPRALVTTPFHLKTLLRSGLALPPVALILSATAPLSPQLAAQAEQATGGMLIEIYGSTETGQVATRRTTETDIWHTFGEIRVRAEAEAGEQPRFVFEGDFIAQPTPMADLLELIDAQRFRLLGRANDLVHVAGRRSSLGHLNYHLNSIPGVEDGAFWLPDEVSDAVVRPVAFVVAPQLDAARIVAALRQRLEAVFVPRQVLHVQALPRAATGKITARALREFALAQLAGEGAPVHFTRRIEADHPCFAGHFPGQPLLPGALLVAQVLEALRQAPALAARLGPTPTLVAAKFLAPLPPGCEIGIALQPEPAPSRAVRFEVRHGQVLAASGRWTPPAPPSTL